MPYSNIKFDSEPGVIRVGKMTYESEVKNPQLLMDINQAAINQGLTVVITTASSGHSKYSKSGNISRHYNGHAVDIAVIYDKYFPNKNVLSSRGNDLANELIKMGYARNVEEGNKKAVLWRISDHYNHIHVSNDPSKSLNKNNNNSLYADGDDVSTVINNHSYNNGPISDTPTGVRYLQFNNEFIERGIKLFQEYSTKTDNEIFEEKKETYNSIGFIPLSLNLKVEGVSGWVIYDKLRINQNLLPPQYPKDFEFIITGISHDISDNNWVTNIETLSTSNISSFNWKKNEISSNPQGGGLNIFNSDATFISSNQNEWMLKVYNAFLTAGLNQNQARIFTAEIGRENSYNPNYLFGSHIDDKNNLTNLGMISWQGKRLIEFKKHLSSQGLILANGSLVRSQQCLNAQARFILWEIRHYDDYKTTLKGFLNRPNVSYELGNEILGTNYIRWAYTNPKYQKGHTNRDFFYTKLLQTT